MLYFAYGSNMNQEQMELRCPNAVLVDTYVLRHWALKERLHADIERCPNSRVYGLLWELSPQCEEALDYYEGVSGGYYKRVILRLRIDGKFTKVLSYMMTENIARTRYFQPFTPSYRAVCREGAISAGIPVSSLYLENGFDPKRTKIKELRKVVKRLNKQKRTKHSFRIVTFFNGALEALKYGTREEADRLLNCAALSFWGLSKLQINRWYYLPMGEDSRQQNRRPTIQTV